ncbi:MAG: hypothetical protein H7177_01980 [Rhizobacter sp.]|nr:hypothetical protein [Bacteriovorax sp.]
MKNLLILSALALSFSATASDLVTLSSGSGFGPRVQSSKLTISENGSIVRVIQTQREVTKETIGKLSANAVASLKEKIELIEDNAQLVDPNPKAPKCMDAPSSSVEVNKGGKDITISLTASCHTSAVQNYNAQDITSLIQGLDKL